MAGVSYAAPWWVNLLHRLPHFDLRWETTSSQFRPEDTDYQQVTRPPGLRVKALGQGPSCRGSLSRPFEGLKTTEPPIEGLGRGGVFLPEGRSPSPPLGSRPPPSRESQPISPRGSPPASLGLPSLSV